MLFLTAGLGLLICEKGGGILGGLSLGQGIYHFIISNNIRSLAV